MADVAEAGLLVGSRRNGGQRLADPSHLPGFGTRLMSAFKELPEGNTGQTSPKSDAQQDSALEPFVLVTRRKQGRQRKQVTASAQPQPRATNVSQETAPGAGDDLPGWTPHKPAKIKKNSQRAKMLGLRAGSQGQRTIEWGLHMIDDTVMTLKKSKFYHAFQGESSSFHVYSMTRVHTCSYTFVLRYRTGANYTLSSLSKGRSYCGRHHHGEGVVVLIYNDRGHLYITDVQCRNRFLWKTGPVFESRTR